MSDTAFTTSSAEAVQLWAADVQREAEVMRFWKKFEGKGVNGIIDTREELITSAGYRINFPFAVKLDTEATSVNGPGYGVRNSDTLWGNEEAQTYYTETVDLQLLRNGERWDMYSQQLSKIELLKSAGISLSRWLSESLDKMMFNLLGGENFNIKTAGTPETVFTGETNSSIIYGGDATTEATIDDTDTFDTTLIDKCIEAAESGYIGTTAIYRIPKINIDGEMMYAMVIHPYQYYDLRNDENWVEAMRLAMERGMDNPIFKGVAGIWNNTMIFVHSFIRVHTDWGSAGTTRGATALFLGAQAGCFAKCKDALAGTYGDDYKYGEKHFRQGISILWFGGFVKTRFNSKDTGVIAVKTAAKSHSS